MLFAASISGPLVRAGECQRESGGVDDLYDLQSIEIPVFTDTEASVGVAFGFVYGDPSCVTLHC